MSERQELFRASMLLSAAGDALGYRNQLWEYCKSGPEIHRQLEELGGLSSIVAKLPDWPISDDTVMHLATADALLECPEVNDRLYLTLARNYVESMNDMEGRKPGPTSMNGCKLLRPDEEDGFRIPFNMSGTGCGAAMRAMCIGLRFGSDLDSLIPVAVESGRMTHHHPTGFLGAVASAFFTSCALQKVPLVTWGRRLLEDAIPQAYTYVEDIGIAIPQTVSIWDYFGAKWRKYLDDRGIEDAVPTTEPNFPKDYGVPERDAIYTTWSYDGWAGRSGPDACMIAYDALLASGKNWEELCSRAMFHGGDSDSTGVIAGSCYGALYGLEGVPEGNYAQLEYHDRIVEAADGLWRMAPSDSE